MNFLKEVLYKCSLMMMMMITNIREKCYHQVPFKFSYIIMLYISDGKKSAMSLHRKWSQESRSHETT